jgi:glycosyltransferase involved in cell wall biosynthesis
MISIIIPAYNVGKKIKYCLFSILAQTYKNFEVIVVNDGSSDKTGGVINSFREEFKNAGIEYRIIDQENGGAPNARNHGFQASHGDYLLFCDADAVLKNNCLWKFMESMDSHPEVSFVYSSFVFGKKLFRLQPFDAQKLRQMPYINSLSLIRTKDFPITGWDESLKKFQDWDLWLTISEQGGTGFWIDEPLFKNYTGGTMSTWLPSFAYKLFPFSPTVIKYKKAVRIIKEKHGILLSKKSGKKNGKRKNYLK